MVRRIGVVFVSRMDNMKTVVIVWLARVVLVLLDRTGDVKREVLYHRVFTKETHA